MDFISLIFSSGTVGDRGAWGHGPSSWILFLFGGRGGGRWWGLSDWLDNLVQVTQWTNNTSVLFHSFCAEYSIEEENGTQSARDCCKLTCCKIGLNIQPYTPPSTPFCRHLFGGEGGGWGVGAGRSTWLVVVRIIIISQCHIGGLGGVGGGALTCWKIYYYYYNILISSSLYIYIYNNWINKPTP